MYSDVRALSEMVEKESAFVDAITHEIRKVIVGQEKMVEGMLIGLLTGGHVLLEGVPGLAKTLTVRTLCDAIQAKFQRIQFTPDLLPADVIGTVIYNQQKGEFLAKQGPIFTNLLLADEINRAPAKVQSALLEAMQELQVTLGDTTYQLERPFMVMATQNPLEQEGTYPLPEAQLDRFMLHIYVDYPKRDEEREIMERVTAAHLRDTGGKNQSHSSGPQLAGASHPPAPHGSPSGASKQDHTAVKAIANPQELLAARRMLGQIYLDEKISNYIVDVVAATRKPKEAGLGEMADMLAHGASPRASIALNLAARAHAFIKHRGYVSPEDVKAVGPDVLRHRIARSYEAEAEEITSDMIVRRVFETVEVP